MSEGESGSQVGSGHDQKGPMGAPEGEIDVGIVVDWEQDEEALGGGGGGEDGGGRICICMLQEEGYLCVRL